MWACIRKPANNFIISLSSILSSHSVHLHLQPPHSGAFHAKQWNRQQLEAALTPNKAKRVSLFGELSHSIQIPVRFLWKWVVGKFSFWFLCIKELFPKSKSFENSSFISCAKAGNEFGIILFGLLCNVKWVFLGILRRLHWLVVQGLEHGERK